MTCHLCHSMAVPGEEWCLYHSKKATRAMHFPNIKHDRGAKPRKDRRRKRANHTKRTRWTSAEYRSQYLKSQHWVDFRAKWYRFNPDAKCWACRAAGPLDLHHVRYDNLGAERLDDVRALCRSCHDQVHVLHKATPSLSLHKCTRAIRKLQRTAP